MDRPVGLQVLSWGDDEVDASPSACFGSLRDPVTPEGRVHEGRLEIQRAAENACRSLQPLLLAAGVFAGIDDSAGQCALRLRRLTGGGDALAPRLATVVAEAAGRVDAMRKLLPVAPAPTPPPPQRTCAAMGGVELGEDLGVRIACQTCHSTYVMLVRPEGSTVECGQPCYPARAVHEEYRRLLLEGSDVHERLYEHVASHRELLAPCPCFHDQQAYACAALANMQIE